ncbi:MAG: hypothetical protein FWC60_12505 [Firmicutes bacterium]|nr:hypothetical protein [Bacillota bacterium]
MSNFLRQYAAYKEEFLKELKSVNVTVNLKNNADSKKVVLELFEEWLKGKTAPRKSQPMANDSFDSFLDEVLFRAKKILLARGIRISYLSLSQQIGIAESWKCIKVFGNDTIFYRIGKTKPRKGPHKGREYLVFDLVMDGHKKQVFVPLLQKKDRIESSLGASLERELPQVEATGKYRLKLLLSYEVVREKNIRLAARKLADFVGTTKPYLDDLGVL